MFLYMQSDGSMHNWNWPPMNVMATGELEPSLDDLELAALIFDRVRQGLCQNCGELPENCSCTYIGD